MRSCSIMVMDHARNVDSDPFCLASMFPLQFVSIHMSICSWLLYPSENRSTNKASKGGRVLFARFRILKHVDRLAHVTWQTHSGVAHNHTPCHNCHVLRKPLLP